MSARQLRVGEVVDGFHLDAFLHRGGMADLWQVSREGSSETFVLKAPQLHGGEGTTTIVSFETERMIMPRLSGVHVPRFIAAGDFDLPYVVMERINGPSLKPELDRPVVENSRQRRVRVMEIRHPDIHELVVRDQVPIRIAKYGLAGRLISLR